MKRLSKYLSIVTLFWPILLSANMSSVEVPTPIENPMLANSQTIPRKVLVIYSPEQSTVFNPDPFRLLAMPLEFLGYIPQFYPVDKPLPENLHNAGYAGIVFWAHTDNSHIKQYLHEWFVKQVKQRVPLVFINDFGFDPSSNLLAPFGLYRDKATTTSSKLQITLDDRAVMNFESPVYPNGHDFIPLTVNEGKVLLQLKNQGGQKEDAAVITSWGAYILNPYAVIVLPNQVTRWVVNPLVFLRLALRLPEMPVPDTTTENGRRIMMVDIEGDGFANLTEWSTPMFAGKKLEDEILNRYQIPTDVSVITGEIAPNGLYPTLSSYLVPIARDIFKLPWVEIASHSFSHPFDWQQLKKESKANSLPLPNYHFDLNAEIIGSVDYINNQLAPLDKKCKVLLWSGYGNAGPSALKIVNEAGLADMGGGHTDITNSLNLWSHIGPLGRSLGDYYQTFSPISNEESYTNNWAGPIYGFEQVIETLKLTDSPYRFKPIDIHYQFYSATKLASLNALKKIYQWALTQPVINFYVSEYVAKVTDFNSIILSKTPDGGWQIQNRGALREMRAPLNLGYPDLKKSTNLAGYSVINHTYYLHLGPALKSILHFTSHPSNLAYLHETNGVITAFERTDKGMTLRLQGNMPLKLVLGNMLGCELWQDSQQLGGVQMPNNFIYYDLATKNSRVLHVKCKYS